MCICNPNLPCFLKHVQFMKIHHPTWYNFCVSICMLFLIFFFTFPVVTKKTQTSQLGISVAVVHSLSQVWPCATARTAGHQASLSFTISQSSLKLMPRVSDAIQPSHPLLSPSPPAFNLSQHQGLFQGVGSSHQMAKVFKLQHQPFRWIFRIDFP